jgi:GDP/UDP-N,N'-diacetylbacillosamine 2-epimerase (hydrolysing)
LPDIVENEKPDWILLAGDRGEQLMGAIVGAFTYTPVAHIQAGELSGNIDGMTRHSIGKYTHLHLAANEDAANRLINLGEQEFRVHNVGAPQIDEMINSEFTSLEQLEDKLFLDLKNQFILTVIHPVTEDYYYASAQAEILIKALNESSLKKIVIMPNNDAGSLEVRSAINEFKQGEYHLFSNLKRQDYLGLLRECSCIVGNSSSGLLEAPTFKVPAINIGRRQDMRFRGINVIDVDFNKEEIVKAINKATSHEFRDYLEHNCVNPYGDGKSSQRILDLLMNTAKDDKLLVKKLTF